MSVTSGSTSSPLTPLLIVTSCALSTTSVELFKWCGYIFWYLYNFVQSRRSYCACVFCYYNINDPTYFLIMVQRIQGVIATYQQRLVDSGSAPTCSFRRAVLGDGGNANTLFLVYLFHDMDVGIQFLKDTGLIRTQMTCETCGRDMRWCVRPQRTDRYRWECRRQGDVPCNRYKSIRHGSCFQQSRLMFQEILFLTYDILRREPVSRIQHEHGFSQNHYLRLAPVLSREHASIP
jgi:hypothetical protein